MNIWIYSLQALLWFYMLGVSLTLFYSRTKWIRLRLLCLGWPNSILHRNDTFKKLVNVIHKINIFAVEVLITLLHTKLKWKYRGQVKYCWSHGDYLVYGSAIVKINLASMWATSLWKGYFLMLMLVISLLPVWNIIDVSRDGLS